MENGGRGYDGDGDGVGNLEREFSSLTLTSAVATPSVTVADAAAAVAVPDAMANNSNSNTDGLFQVMKAVEAAEATIKQQVEENNRLRSELQKKIQELEKYKLDESKGRNPHMIGNYAGRIDGSQIVHQSVPVLASQTDGIRSIDDTFTHDASDTMIQKYLPQNIEDHMMQPHVDSHSEKKYINGTLKMLKGGQAVSDNVGFSQFSSPSTTSFSPPRHQTEGEYDPRLNSSGHGLMPMPMAEINNSRSLLKQDLGLKLREHEEEILQLRKHLADYSIKEAQICNEKYVLEKRIAYMRMAFDQMQQDLVDAASKALSYRQDIIEENIRLTYALQAAQQERSTFVSSLMPLLAEYSLQPTNADAQSIVSNLKVLFKHLQEKLIITEEKLKESQYQLGPWRLDVNPSHFSPSPSHFIGNQNGLELVPQAAYSNEKTPVSLDPSTTTDWDVVGHHRGGFNGVTNNQMPDDLAKYSPLASRNAGHQEVPAKLGVSQGDSHPLRNSEEVANKQVTFSDPVSSSEMDDPDMDGQHNEREAFVNWDSKTSPYSTTLEDNTSPYSPFLPPVLEEPSSSFSEDPALEDDPVPAIESLQISGEALLGQELQACGYSVNGTTSCNFEWVRHLEDGSVNYIDGAKQPNYLVTADDVDTYLAIEVQPLDNRKRKGELVKVFANEHRKITCDPEMQSHIEKTLQTGHASFRVSLSTGYLDIWEPATLAIKREGYSIKCTGPNAIITEKFSPATIVSIPCGHPTAFSISGSGGVERVLRAEGSSTDISCSRDTIVLTLRLFIIKAGDRKKGKKRGIFFNKV